MNDAEISLLLVFLVGSYGNVYGQDNNDKQPSTDYSGVFSGGFGFVSVRVLLIVMFCMCGSYLCVHFTCCHEYMCEPDGNSGCGYRRPADEEMKPTNADDETV